MADTAHYQTDLKLEEMEKRRLRFEKVKALFDLYGVEYSE